MKDLLRNACREADDWEEEAIQVEVLKHSLDGMAVDTEGDTGHAQIQTAADHVLRCQDVLVGRSNVAWNTTCRHTDRV